MDFGEAAALARRGLAAGAFVAAVAWSGPAWAID